MIRDKKAVGSLFLTKSKLDVDPLSGEEVEKIVAGLFKLEPALVAKMGEILSRSLHLLEATSRNTPANYHGG